MLVFAVVQQQSTRFRLAQRVARSVCSRHVFAISQITINLVHTLTMFVVVAATGALIKTPQNAVGLQEEPIVLECASNSSDIIWSYNATNISGPGCTATDPRLRRPWIETTPEPTALWSSRELTLRDSMVRMAAPMDQ